MLVSTNQNRPLSGISDLNYQYFDDYPLQAVDEKKHLDADVKETIPENFPEELFNKIFYHLGNLERSSFESFDKFKFALLVSKKWLLIIDNLINVLCGKVNKESLSIFFDKEGDESEEIRFKGINEDERKEFNKILRRYGKKIVEKFKEITFRFKPRLKNESDCLIENEFENFAIIFQVYKFCDLIKYRNSNTCNDNSRNYNIENFNSLKELVNAANTPYEWIDNCKGCSSRLILNNQHLISIPAEISRREDLRVVHLNSNYIVSLPREIMNLKNLRILKLSDNDLTDFNWEVLETIHLNMLLLRNIQLVSFPKIILKNNYLEKLELSKNKLNSIPNEVLKLKNLRLLDLRDNPLISMPAIKDPSKQISFKESNNNKKVLTILLSEDKKHLMENCENQNDRAENTNNCILQ